MGWGRTWIELAAEPPTLLSDGGARVRVRGHALGLLRCQDQRRWVFGDFDQTFRVQAPAGSCVRVQVAGLLGAASLQVPWQPRAALVSPTSPLPSACERVAECPRLLAIRVKLPTLRLSGLPRVGRLEAQGVKGDRLDEQQSG